MSSRANRRLPAGYRAAVLHRNRSFWASPRDGVLSGWTKAYTIQTQLTEAKFKHGQIRPRRQCLPVTCRTDDSAYCGCVRHGS